MSRKNVIESRIASLEGELAELEKFGEDIYEDGEVLIFSLRFSEVKKYRYAAIKAAGKWFITGGKNPGSYLSWDDLTDFWRRGNVAKVRVVTATKRVL